MRRSMSRGTRIAISVTAVWFMMSVPAMVFALSGGVSSENAAHMSATEALILSYSYLALIAGILVLRVGVIVLLVYIAVKFFTRRSDDRSRLVESEETQ